MENNYIIWIENGMTTMAKIVDESDVKVTRVRKEFEYFITNPCAVMNMEYGLTADLQPVAPNDPKAVTIRFSTKMAPYILPNAFKNEAESVFTVSLDNVVYNVISEDNDIVKVYNATLESFKK